MIKIGVSACVMGEKVRYDGGHKQSKYVVRHLKKTFDFVPFCPEVGMGMTVPRPTIHLRDFGDDIRLVDSRNPAIDHTNNLSSFFDSVADKIGDLDGYIVAAKSPSCGMERIKVYDEDGNVLHRKGRGLYTEKLMKKFPNLPVEEDGRLNDQGIRESFFARVLAHNEFRLRVLSEPSMHNLVKFHSQYKFQVLAYNPEKYRELGSLVANHEGRDVQEVVSEYIAGLMSAMSGTASRKKHTNVLMHLQGFLKKHLSSDDKQELSQQIEHYRLGHLPLLAPLTLLRHHAKKYAPTYLQQQRYLEPYPLELGIHA